MARIKRGVTKHRRHKQVLEATRGHRGTRSTLYKRAHESLIKALSHAYRHRRQRKGTMRRLWILRIGAAARREGLSYNALVHGLSQANVSVDRKALADLAVRDPAAFSELAAVARQQLAASESPKVEGPGPLTAPGPGPSAPST